MNNTTLLAIFQLVAFLFSVVVHEVAHGLMALRLGDETAKRFGRLTLNPLKHLDPVGSILLPLLLFWTNSPVIFGWAKPVPYNPAALHKDYRYGPLKVALAGPLSNLAIAFSFGFFIRISQSFFDPVTLAFLSFIVFINTLLAVFNLIPIPPLDGSKILAGFLPVRYFSLVENLGFQGVFILLIILFFFPQIIWLPVTLIFRWLVGSTIFAYFSSIF